MISRIFTKFVAGYKELTPTTKGFIILGVILILGIILRWDTVMEEVKRGFNFFNGN